jgi:hypothetical protein
LAVLARAHWAKTVVLESIAHTQNYGEASTYYHVISVMTN